MSSKRIVNGYVDERIIRLLDRKAKETKRSKTWIVSTIIERWYKRQEGKAA